jgi:hypothetical protein
MKKIILSIIVLVCCIAFANANTSSINKINQPIDTCCIAGSWGVSHWGTTAATTLIVPAPTTITAGQPIYFNMAYSCDPRCGLSTPTFEYKIMDLGCNTVLYTTGAGKPASYSFIVPTSITSTTVSVQVTVKCGSWTCKSICIKQCVVKNCCGTTASWGAMHYQKIFPTTGTVNTFTPSTLFTTSINSGNKYSLVVNFNCTSGCACKLVYKMDGVVVGSALCGSAVTITIPAAGGHVLEISSYCGGVVCKSVKYQFKSI